jgi:hypothetical protein
VWIDGSPSDMKLARVHGHWLVKDIRVGKIEKL